MKLALTTAVLAGLLAPAASLSYLDSLSKSNPVVSQPSGGSQGANGASYLDALAGQSSPAASAPSGGGMSSYLDSLPPSGASASVSASSSWGAAPTPEPEPTPEPAQSVSNDFELPAWGVTGGTDLSGSGIKGYLDSIMSSGNTAPTGGGLTGYLDALPQGPSASGAGLKGYLDGLPQAPAVSGAGIKSFADGLTPSSGSGPSVASYAPSSASRSASPSVSYSNGHAAGSDVGFTFEADNLSDLVKQMGDSSTIRFSGSVENVSFN